MLLRIVIYTYPFHFLVQHLSISFCSALLSCVCSQDRGEFPSLQTQGPLPRLHSVASCTTYSLDPASPLPCSPIFSCFFPHRPLFLCVSPWCRNSPEVGVFCLLKSQVVASVMGPLWCFPHWACLSRLLQTAPLVCKSPWAMGHLLIQSQSEVLGFLCVWNASSAPLPCPQTLPLPFFSTWHPACPSMFSPYSAFWTNSNNQISPSPFLTHALLGIQQHLVLLSPGHEAHMCLSSPLSPEPPKLRDCVCPPTSLRVPEHSRPCGSFG